MPSYREMNITHTIFADAGPEDVATWFIEAIGGQTVAHMLVQRHIDHWGWYRIAEFHGVPASTAKRWILAAHAKLRKHGKMPAAWENTPRIATEAA